MLRDAQQKVLIAVEESSEVSFLLETYSAALKKSQGLDTLPVNPNSEDNPQDAVICMNGKAINGFHPKVDDDSRNRIPRNRSRMAPQAFVDSAVSLVVSILHATCSSRIKGTVRNDARIILRQLVRSGKLSARSHLALIIEGGQSFRFSQLLKALHLSSHEASGTRSAYTPFDLANDLLSYCKDASEHQMMAMIRSTISQSIAKDIASYFVRESKNCTHFPFVAMSVKFMALESTCDLSSDKRLQFANLGNRLIVFGTIHLMQRIVGYSKCNVFLLRDSLCHELDHREIVVMTRCLIGIISGSFKLDRELTVGATSNLLRWLAVLCDSFRGIIAANDQERIGRVITKELSNSSCILSLRKSVEEALDAVNAQKTGRFEAAHVVSDKKAGASLPSYQFERLVF
jgi:hypothetical protein